jgi:hypothetical protein
MKYICLGYHEEKKTNAMDPVEGVALMDECFAYDEELRRNGHFIGGEALQSVSNAATLTWEDGQVIVSDGPFAETKEQLGGILILEAVDLNHAIQIMSKHPGVRAGSFEIRPAADLEAMMEASRERLRLRGEN